MSEYINDFEVRKAILNLLGGNSSNCSNTYEVDLEILKIYEEGGGSTGGGSTDGGGKAKVAEIDINDRCIDDGKWNANAIDVSLLTSLNYFFQQCSSLVEVDLSSWDVSNISSMGFIFDYCNSLQSISGLSNWNTSNVTYMGNMFRYCNSLQNLNLSDWNTGNVTNMQSMFDECKELQSVGDLSNWDVSKVTNMNRIFYKCQSLQNLNLSDWNTGNITSLYNMFYECNLLQSIGDLSNWDVSKVTNIGNMFEDCKSLQNLNLSGWNTGNVKTMDYVFYNANINNLDITGWTDVSNITSIVGFCSTSSNIPTFVGGRTIDDVINNNITILNGLKIATTNFLLGHYADRASLRALINGLADLTGQTTVTLNLTSVLVKEKLTEEDIAIATAKNWTIA